MNQLVTNFYRPCDLCFFYKKPYQSDIPWDILANFAMAKRAPEGYTLNLSQLAETQHALYSDLVALQEAYRPLNDSEVILHNTVWGIIEEVFPRIPWQKIVRTGPQPNQPTSFFIEKEWTEPTLNIADAINILTDKEYDSSLSYIAIGSYDTDTNFDAGGLARTCKVLLWDIEKCLKDILTSPLYFHQNNTFS